MMSEKKSIVNQASEYNSKDVNDKILLNIRDLEQKIHVLYEGKKSQRRVLIVLRETNGITQRELTERLGIKPASMSEVLSKLTAKGYVSRVPSSIDKRTMIITLTEDGKRIADEAFEYRSLRIVEMLSALDDEEKGVLLSLLEKFNTP
jgi:DNA-binding MarR family transcriptional regulator